MAIQVQPRIGLDLRSKSLEFDHFFSFEVGKYVMEDSALEEARVTCISRAENYRYWRKIVRLLKNVKRFQVQNWWYVHFICNCFIV